MVEPVELVIGPCTGKNEQSTLRYNLRKYGVISKGDMDNRGPGTVFNWMEHHAHEHYVPSGFMSGGDWHCGICFHHITNIYKYVSIDGRRPVVDINDKIRLNMPPVLIAGCECIQLSDFMRTAIAKVNSTFKFKDYVISFKYGLMSADDIIRNWQAWPVEIFAFPLECFYFSPGLRRKLMLGQTNMGYGRHVILHNRTARLEWTRAINAPRTVKAWSLFYGWDDGGRICTVDTVEQVAEYGRYAIVSRRNAGRLCMEGF